MLERELSGKISVFASKHKVLKIKLTTLGTYGESGWPDWMFLRSGKIVFMELKKPGSESTKNQRYKQELLAAEGFTVYRDIDDVEVAKAILRKEFNLP